MKIAIEAQRIFRENKHGMDFVALEIIRELQKKDKKNEYYIIVSPGKDECLKESDNLRIVKLKCPTYPLWEQIALPLAIKKIKPDILHCTSNTAPLYCPAKLILTLHDIIYLEKKNVKNDSIYQKMGWHYRRFIVPKIIKKCKGVITVSQFESKQIQSKLNIPKESLFVIYNGYNNCFKPLNKELETIQKYISEEGFYFFLGNTDPKKNTLQLLKAYAIYLKKSIIKRSLLIADLKEDFVISILEKEKITEIRPYLKLSGYIPNNDLPALYNAAFAFLYPSLRESFGIPILEAMACGTPVITSNTSSMPEIAGENALLINPRDAHDIADKMLQLENDSELYLKQKNNGLERIKKFSWEKSANELLLLYNHIINKNQ